jgi:RNA polymerase sigma factor (sigma-70 family)
VLRSPDQRGNRWDNRGVTGIYLFVTSVAVQDAPRAVSTVRLAAEGDEAAFTRLVTEHRESMARVAFVICGDAEMTRDAVQSAWSIAWRRLPTLRDPDQVRPWLIAIAANEARQLLRAQRRRPVVDISETPQRDERNDPAGQIALVDLQRALADLKPDDRRLLALRFVAGLDSADIARELGLSASGVRSRLARLIARLRTDIDDD